ncbi:unnamed protein product [Alopecurus aequalis]
MGLDNEVTAAKLTDDLVVDILSRVTYKDFCRSKCAYKAWSAFSSDPDYHKKLPKKITNGLLYQGQNKPAIPLISLSQDGGEIDGILADVPHYEHLQFLDCCNGLVLCKYRSNYSSTHICRFVVCNPATGQWRIIPDTHHIEDDPHYVTILAFDPSWSPQFYIFNFHLNHDHGLILGTSKLEIFQSKSSAWLVDDSLDPGLDLSLRTHLFVDGKLYVAVRYQVLVFEDLEAMSNGMPPYHETIRLPPEASYLDAFGRDQFVHYDNDGHDGDDEWFWSRDYWIVDLDLERELVFLCDQKAKKLLSYNISTGKLNAIQDSLEWHQYYVYVPCYSELPAQEPSIE